MLGVSSGCILSRLSSHIQFFEKNTFEYRNRENLTSVKKGKARSFETPSSDKGTWNDFAWTIIISGEQISFLCILKGSTTVY